MAPESIQWFLEVKGRSTGPWTLNQIREFLSKGQIQTTHRVCPTSGGEWVELRQILEAEFASPPPGPPASSVHLPPRPSAEVVRPPQDDDSSSQNWNDSTKELFDVLQSVKERKVTPPKPALSTNTPASKGGLPQPLLFGVSAALALAVTVWAILQVVHKNSPKLAETPTTQTVHTVEAAHTTAPVANAQPTHAAPPQPAKLQPTNPTAILKVNQPTIPHPRFTFTPPKPTPTHDLEAEREKERDRELERERERDRREELDRMREAAAERNAPDWKARDDRGEAVPMDREDPYGNVAPPSEPGAPRLAPNQGAFPPGAPNGAQGNPGSEAGYYDSQYPAR